MPETSGLAAKHSGGWGMNPHTNNESSDDTILISIQPKMMNLDNPRVLSVVGVVGGVMLKSGQASTRLLR
jgi:hypothetical protein